MLFAWRFSRTFASRFNFANVVFFLPAKIDLQVAQRTAPTGGALSTVLRSADARPHLKRLATPTRTLLGAPGRGVAPTTGGEGSHRIVDPSRGAAVHARRTPCHRPCLVTI